MAWLSLKVRTDCQHAERLADALLDAGALAVSIEDADAGTVDEQPQFGEPGSISRPGWERSLVVALLKADTDVRQLLGQCAVLAGLEQLPAFSQEEVAEQDWVRLTQSQFDPVEITPSFWIVPTWHEPPAAAAQCLRLDPGLAFGTGTHPTTRMCLRWIAAHPPTAQRVLDYGCGSGILAMAARLFGAGETDAVDIDPSAVSSTQVNAAANHVQLNAGLPDLAQGTYQLVLANILATPLKVLAPLLCARLAPGASLVLAGILSRQAEELQQAYAPWVQLVVADEQEGWILMTATAPTP